MQVEQVPIALGPVGTIVFGLIIFALAVLNAVQYYKAKNVERLTNALHVTETEMDVYKSRCERLEKENAELNQQVGELKAKTDLSAVLAMLSETISLNRESVDLSRKFDRENAQLNSSIVRALEKHGESDIQIFGSIDKSIRETAATLVELKQEIQDHRKNASVMIDSVLHEIRNLKHE